MTKEEYYESVLQNREIIKDVKNLKCVCPELQCEWHGRCKQCVALHRYYKDHIPNCLQPILNDKINELAKVCELKTERKEETPLEYRQYAKERDKELNEEID